MADFDLLFKKFMEDVAAKRITTRDNASRITEYSHSVREIDGVSGDRVDRHTVSSSTENNDTKKTKKTKRPSKPTKISPNDELQKALKEIPSYKLEILYFSLCTLSLSQHTPLLSIGAWSLLETLTAICGRTIKSDFHSYLNGKKLEDIGTCKKTEASSIREAVKRVSEYGNSTKHNKTSAAFNGEQLANDFETMTQMLIDLAVNAKGKT